jgi:hypothetical protein
MELKLTLRKAVSPLVSTTWMKIICNALDIYEQFNRATNLRDGIDIFVPQSSGTA